MTDVPDHLRQISLGEETESTSYEEKDRNKYIIPQVDGTVDSRDSLNQTLDSIDLTISPVKYRNAQRNTEMSNDDTSDKMKWSNLTKIKLEKFMEKIQMNKEIWTILVKI